MEKVQRLSGGGQLVSCLRYSLTLLKGSPRMKGPSSLESWGALQMHGLLVPQG